MTDSLEFPELYVEGQDDCYAIIELLARHDIVLDRDSGPVIIKNVKNDIGVLKTMRTAAKASTDRPVAFVLDADRHLVDRWKSVCDHLDNLQLLLPAVMPEDGFVQLSPVNNANIGVWIMPDNRTDAGQLEDLIKTLVPAQDKLLPHAQTSTEKAQNLGATFPAKDFRKALLHAWLAWQEKPGNSYGLAIKAKYFRHDSDAAMKFVKWFRAIFAGAVPRAGD